jgi:NAD(P)H-dependent flavin oxidoreductase YrpB (nitropropane dioxygenase family)
MQKWKSTAARVVAGAMPAHGKLRASPGEQVLNDSRKLFENLRAPVIGAPMFLVSGPQLVIEQCKAGVIGTFPALNARPQELLDAWLTEIEETLDRYRRDHPNAST